jgi:hypothetical protein
LKMRVAVDSTESFVGGYAALSVFVKNYSMIKKIRFSTKLALRSSGKADF